MGFSKIGSTTKFLFSLEVNFGSIITTAKTHEISYKFLFIWANSLTNNAKETVAWNNSRLSLTLCINYLCLNMCIFYVLLHLCLTHGKVKGRAKLSRSRKNLFKTNKNLEHNLKFFFPIQMIFNVPFILQICRFWLYSAADCYSHPPWPCQYTQSMWQGICPAQSSWSFHATGSCHLLEAQEVWDHNQWQMPNPQSPWWWPHDWKHGPHLLSNQVQRQCRMLDLEKHLHFIISSFWINTILLILVST